MIFGKYAIRAKELSDEELGPYHAFISIGGKDMVEIIAQDDCYSIHYPNGGVKKNKHVVDELISMMPKSLLAEPDCLVSPISWLIIQLGEWLRAEMLAEEAYKEYPGDDTFIVALSRSELPIDFWALSRLSYTDAELREDIMANTCQLSRKCARGGVVIIPRSQGFVFPAWPQPAAPGKCEKICE